MDFSADCWRDRAHFGGRIASAIVTCRRMMMLIHDSWTRLLDLAVATVTAGNVTSNRARSDYSTLILAVRITLAHFSISFAMNFVNSAGELR